MGWPNNYVQGVYDSTGKVVGVEDGVGGEIGFIQKTSSMFGKYTDKVNYLISKCIGFGSSTPDTATRAGLTPANTLYYHPQLGNDANSGLTHLLPKQNLPASPDSAGALGLVANTKYLIASGSTLTLAGTNANFIRVQANSPSNIIMSVYDSDATSPTYGQEILNQPNPFVRALAGMWITAAEKAKYYFTLDVNTPPNVATQTRAFFMYHNGSIATVGKICLRGAVIKNATIGALQIRNADVRFEDCVVEKMLQDPDISGGTGGFGIRNESNGNFDGARIWMSEVGEDCFWLYDSIAPYGCTNSLVDSAIWHTCDMQKNTGQHSDIFQFNSYPKNFVFRRLAIVHLVQDKALVGGDTNSGGAVLVSTGALGTDTPGGLMEDVVFITNHQGTYMQKQSGVTFRRCVGLLVKRKVGAPTDLITWEQGNNVEDNCVWAIETGMTQKHRKMQIPATAYSNFANTVELEV